MKAKHRLQELVGKDQADLIIDRIREAPALVPELVEENEAIVAVSYIVPGADEFAEWDELERIIQCHHQEAQRMGCVVHFKLEAVN